MSYLVSCREALWRERGERDRKEKKREKKEGREGGRNEGRQADVTQWAGDIVHSGVLE